MDGVLSLNKMSQNKKYGFTKRAPKNHRDSPWPSPRFKFQSDPTQLPIECNLSQTTQATQIKTQTQTQTQQTTTHPSPLSEASLSSYCDCGFPFNEKQKNNEKCTKMNDRCNNNNDNETKKCQKSVTNLNNNTNTLQKHKNMKSVENNEKCDNNNNDNKYDKLQTKQQNTQRWNDTSIDRLALSILR